MAIFPVTRVSAGDNLSLGTPSISNKAQAVSVYGINSFRSTTAFLNQAGKQSAGLSLSMTSPNTLVSGKAVRFTFSGSIVQPKVTAGDLLVFGTPDVSHAAVKIYQKGFVATKFGLSVFFNGSNSPTEFNLLQPRTPYTAKNISFHFGPILVASAGIGETLVVGSELKAVNAFNARPDGIPSNVKSSSATFVRSSINSGKVDINLQQPLLAPIGRCNFNFGGTSLISQAGAISGNPIFGKPAVTKVDSFTVPSINPPPIKLPIVYSKKILETGLLGVVDFSMFGTNQPVNAKNISFNFWNDGQITPAAFQSSEFGTASISNYLTYTNPSSWISSKWGGVSVFNLTTITKPIGIPATSIVPAPNIRLNTTLVQLIRSGIDSFIAGTPAIRNFNQTIIGNGFDSAIVSTPKTYNLKQYAPIQGRDQSLYGNPYLMGGVRWLVVTGFNANEYGKTTLINTTANHYVYPQGLSDAVVSAPNVSPRMIRPTGFYHGAIGKPDIRIPVLLPNGFVSPSYGMPAIWYHTRPLTPAGIPSFESGYPRVADPTQFIQAPSLLTSAIFGDTATRNLSFRVNAPAIFDGAFSDYSTLTNSNRFYNPRGVDSLAIGIASINNNTPELLPISFGKHEVGISAVGHRVRTIYPTGFDRLLLGTPVVIKAPELLVQGRASANAGTPTIWHKVRVIRSSGFDSQIFGDARLWFRYRYVSPESWQSPKMGVANLTHGLREVVARGSASATYGQPWISRGTRLIEPGSIHKEFATNHLVGRKQEILPIGYIATLWGTRIIPESQPLYPLGFAGVWGLTSISLYTQYVKPVGYISIGQQPADRWGGAIVYNSVQYLIQNFDGGSGLVPPKWSDWQSIENRNKVMGVTGFASQKFGYSQIDNNAAQLSPTGIEPPVSNRTMVSHGVRYLPLDGLEPPLMSTWAVIYNGARVVAPAGKVQMLSGIPAVVNTRREYRNVGRIDSLEVGDPTIGYRIRTIDIEPRYSIAPPQINLPIVDLYTRYVSFQGYETAKYGLPALSIHLRVIEPKWVHRDNQGYPALHNVTPELLINGHNSDEYGDTHIRTQWREVEAQGDNSNVFGQYKISDTKQVIDVRGLLSSISSQKHVVTKTGTNPYVTQNIWLNDESGMSGGQGNGISNKNNFGMPFFNQNVLYQRGHQSSRFGAVLMWSNNIVVDGGIAIDGVSSKASVSNRNNIISSAGGIEPIIALGKPRLSPYTIWAVVEAPEQAKLNHGATGLHYVGGFGGAPVGIVMGRPKIESTIRTIYPFSILATGFSKPELSLSLQIIQPQSFRVARFGIPSIPFTPQEIVLRDGINDLQWGYAKIGRPPYKGPQTIAAKGFNEFRSGQHYSDNFIRTLAALGHDSLDMGYSRGNDNPFMWQSLRVGERIPTSIGAGTTDLYGTPTIWHRVRGIELEGFNAFASGYELSKFKERMVVANSDKQLPRSSYISAVGVNSKNSFGATDLKYGQHFIRPDGNSDQFRKGAF